MSIRAVSVSIDQEASEMAVTLNPVSTQIPIIDFAPFLNGNAADKQAVASQIDRACREIGFLYLKNHGVSKSLLEQVFAQAKQFFALPLETKQQIAWDETNRGYDTLEGQSFDPTKPGDLKESFLYGREVSVDELSAVNDSPYAPIECQPNKWLPDQPEFRTTLLQFLDACHEATFRVLEAFAIALQVPENFFTELHTKQNYTIRLLRYPPLTQAPKAGQPRLGEHSDWGSITLLFQNQVEGLEVCTAQGEWIIAPVIPDTVLVNTGDLMEQWTNDRFRSTKHRVKIPTDYTTAKERYSIAAFAVPNYDANIVCLDSCQSEQEPAKYAPVLSGEYIMQKIRATYG
jgi:isopenicillin N synthase-like dioxygenase